MARLKAPEPLSSAHDLTSFDCGQPALNDWLRHRALKNESRFSLTFVVCENIRVVAFASLSAGSVARESAPSGLRRNAPETIPVSILTRLAVDRSFAGQGLGSDLLADALARCAMAAKTLGIAAVLVHAKNDAAKSFYLTRARFREYPPDSRILYLPMEALNAPD